MLTLSDLRSRFRPTPTHDDETEPVADLPGVYAPRYRSRLGVRYGVVRRWGPGKRSALAALRQAKMDLPESFVAALAGELAALTRSLHGSWTGCVVPVACGHSRRRDGLSFRIGVAVAQCLGAEFFEAFAFRPIAGSSHPRTIRDLPPLEVLAVPDAPALVVDDITTSGYHMHEALTALRSRGCQASGLAWIGD